MLKTFHIKYQSIGIEEMDTVIVAMGENFAQSILITALLKKHLGIPKVIARAINDIHKDILILVGADRIVLPEKEVGTRLADTLSSSLTDLTRLTKEFSISKIRAPHSFVGKTIQELNLPDKYTVHCVGIEENANTITPVDKSYSIKQGDRLIVAGNNSDLEKLTKL